MQAEVSLMNPCSQENLFLYLRKEVILFQLELLIGYVSLLLNGFTLWISYLHGKFCELYCSLCIWWWRFLVYYSSLFFFFFWSVIQEPFQLSWKFNIILYFFQDGPLRIETSTTGSMSTISKIIRMVCPVLSLFQQTNCEIIMFWGNLAKDTASLKASNLECHMMIVSIISVSFYFVYLFIYFLYMGQFYLSWISYTETSRS